MEYSYLMEYLPTRFDANQEQWDARKEVYNFKDGCCSQLIKNSFCKVVERITGNDKYNWVVLFIPASTELNTLNRFSALASYITSRTGVHATTEAIKTDASRNPTHMGGNHFVDHTDEYIFDPSIFRGKNVILIDDVITSGNSFMNCARVLLNKGAESVRGLFVAKTVNPEWNHSIA